ncbi:hypothetical protein SKAU_G00008430, partial [Synaphobranchus kaupii]
MRGGWEHNPSFLSEPSPLIQMPPACTHSGKSVAFTGLPNHATTSFRSCPDPAALKGCYLANYHLWSKVCAAVPPPAPSPKPQACPCAEVQSDYSHSAPQDPHAMLGDYTH